MTKLTVEELGMLERSWMPGGKMGEVFALARQAMQHKQNATDETTISNSPVARWKLTSNYQWASHTVQMMKAAGDALAAAIEAKDATIKVKDAEIRTLRNYGVAAQEKLETQVALSSQAELRARNAQDRIAKLEGALEEIADKDGYINSKAYARAALKDDTIA